LSGRCDQVFHVTRLPSTGAARRARPDPASEAPPVALSAYFLKGVMPDRDLKDIYLGMLQLMGLQVPGLIPVFFPQVALWLPSVLVQ
jgi:hypothetical protein